ncbi:hypothetical protein H6F90_02720 [Trichocoleus sp. FACHB-591]|uniref:hypothetical protein n=1 Tax=Trichocoleus sp. FACHB-591 TaxID=2692872 RepID=UPI0016873E0A|nr:hypothetical protein [Trichocoleus sp. FACHB-591]MBD2094067.1 hypothetical protein [Trichocoleus sp. FACHB-591]
MSEPSVRRKLPECDRCIFYAHTPFLVCTSHPEGVSSNSCLDFQRDPMAEPEEFWEPEGASYYNGDLIVTPQQRWSRLEKLALLDTHPIFTGRCPDCEVRITPKTLRVHWDCEHCGWRDDSV